MSGQPRPVTVLPWAVEATYPSGPFSGLPTKVTPTGDIFIPGAIGNGATKVPAQWLNYLFNAYADAIQQAQDWAGNAPALNWFGLASPSVIFGGSGTAVQSIRWEDNSAVRQWLVSGYYYTGSTYEALVYVTGDLSQTWTEAGTTFFASDASGFAGSACCVDPVTENLYFAAATGKGGTITIAKATTTGGAWSTSTTIAATGAGAVGCCTVGSAACFSYVKSGLTGSAIVSTTNSGTSWSTFTPTVTPVEWLLVSNGTMALALGVGSSYTTVSGTYYSSTNGTTWTAQTLPAQMAAADVPTGLAWTVDSTGSCWIMSVTQASSGDTQFYRSANGTSWTQVASGTGHLLGGGSPPAGVYDLAAIGALLVATGNPGGSGQTGASRVYFSVDGAVTWYPSPHTVASNQNSSYVGWVRNRVAASDTGFVMANSTGVKFSFQSGLSDLAV